MRTEAGGGAREAVLERVRGALRTSAGTGTAAERWAAIPREYRRETAASRDEVVDLLAERLRDYGAQVLRCPASEVRWAVGDVLGERGVRRIVLPAGFPEGVVPEGLASVRDDALSAAELDGYDGVITECTVAIAETGTLVLQNVAGQGRRAVSLVPDYHLCLVDVRRVVATVPEAIRALERTATLPTTFVSGPSATADIEMTRIKGVHGPRFLDVLLTFK